MEIGDAGAMRNRDGQTAGHVGIRNPGKRVETLGEVMIHIGRRLVEGARAGSAKTGRGAGVRIFTEVVLQLPIPDIGEYRYGELACPFICCPIPCTAIPIPPCCLAKS